MELTNKEKNELYEIYKNSDYYFITFEEWIKENVTRCLSCNNLILKNEDWTSLETCDGYYCGSCRP